MTGVCKSGGRESPKVVEGLFEKLVEESRGFGLPEGRRLALSVEF